MGRQEVDDLAAIGFIRNAINPACLLPGRQRVAHVLGLGKLPWPPSFESGSRCRRQCDGSPGPSDQRRDPEGSRLNSGLICPCLR